MAEPEEEGRAERPQARRRAPRRRPKEGARGPQAPSGREGAVVGPPAAGAQRGLEAELERLRRATGLRLDRDGRWWHEGQPVRHPRIDQALHAGIDRHPTSGEYVVRIGREWCYVEVEDTPILVLGATPRGAGIELRLSDGTSERLDPETLHLAEDGMLYAAVRGGALPARFSRPAFHALAPLLEEEDGAPVLRLGRRRHPIAKGAR